MWEVLFAVVLTASFTITAQGDGKVEEDPIKDAGAKPSSIIWSVPGERELVLREEDEDAVDLGGLKLGMTEAEIIDLLGYPRMMFQNSSSDRDNRLVWGTVSRSYIPSFPSTSAHSTIPFDSDSMRAFRVPLEEPDFLISPELGTQNPEAFDYRGNCSARVSPDGIVVEIENRRRCHVIHRLPVAVAHIQGGYSCIPGAGVELTFIGDASTTKPDGGTSSLLTYEWTSYSASLGERETLSTASQLTLALPPGNHEITLQVTDGAGRSDTSTLEFTIPDDCDEDHPMAE